MLMSDNSREEMIRYLRDRMSYLKKLEQEVYRSPEQLVRSSYDPKQRLRENEAWITSLYDLPDAKLKEMYEDEVRDSNGFLDHSVFAAGVFEPGVATADFNRWGKRPSWSSEEAVALTLGKDPDLVNWERVQNYVGHHAFADEYAELRERIGRAEGVGGLAFPVKPEQFVIWLKHNGIPCPEELESALPGPPRRCRRRARFEQRFGSSAQRVEGGERHPSAESLRAGAPVTGKPAGLDERSE